MHKKEKRKKGKKEKRKKGNYFFIKASFTTYGTELNNALSHFQNTVNLLRSIIFFILEEGGTITLANIAGLVKYIYDKFYQFIDR